MRKKIYISNALRGLPNNILKPLYVNITNRLAQKGYDVSYPVGEMGAAFLKYTIPPDCDGLYPFNGWEGRIQGSLKCKKPEKEVCYFLTRILSRRYRPSKYPGRGSLSAVE